MTKGSKIALGIVAGIIGLVLVGSCGSDDTGKPAVKTDNPAAATSEPRPKKTTAPKPESIIAAEEFKAFVGQYGQPAERAAAEHVTKIRVDDDDLDNVMVTADVHTDFKGGIMSPDRDSAHLIASAFADWKKAKNGLVTVYGANGKLITNGNF